VSARDEGAAGAGGALANVGLRRLLFAFAALTLAEWAFVTALSIHASAALIGRPRLGAPCALAFVAAGVLLIPVGVFDSAVIAVAVVAWWRCSACAARSWSPGCRWRWW
jgi:hypothetical protein